MGLVFGVFLVVIAVMATAQAMLVTTHFSSAALDAAVSRDRAFIRLFVASNILPSDLGPAGPSTARVRELEQALATVVEDGDIERLELRNTSGRVLAASVRNQHDERVPGSTDYASAADGFTSVSLIETDDPSEMAATTGSHGPLLR